MGAKSTPPAVVKAPRLPCVGCGALVEGSRCSCGMVVKAGPFRVVRLIAQNAHARMYVAEDSAGRRAALKEFIFAAAPEQKAVDIFYREANLLQKIQNPHIPRFIGAFHEGKGPQLRLYLAQELVVGEPLDQRLQRRRIEEGEALSIAREVLETLRTLHENKPLILHRDIKPANLIRRLGGQIALVDFGAARELNADAISGATVVGTVGYMPPEMIMGGNIDVTSDLYSLGATLLHLTTRKGPENFLDDDMAIDFGKESNLSPQFKKFLTKLAARRRDQRFTSAAEALKALDQVTSQVAALSSSMSTVPSKPAIVLKTVARSAGLVVALALVGTVIALVANVVTGDGLFWTKSHEESKAAVATAAAKPVASAAPKPTPSSTPEAQIVPVTFDAAKQFSLPANPSGPWTYGWSDQLGGEFKKFGSGFAVSVGDQKTERWNQGGEGSPPPEMVVSRSDKPVSRGGAVFAPGQLVLNPGLQGEFAVLRWTAPKAGHFLISSKFVGVCQKGQKTVANVYMLHGRKVMWSDSLNASERPNEISTEKTIILNEKETIDFVVGASNAGAECRHTGVDVAVTEG